MGTVGRGAVGVVFKSVQLQFMITSVKGLRAQGRLGGTRPLRHHLSWRQEPRGRHRFACKHLHRCGQSASLYLSKTT